MALNPFLEKTEMLLLYHLARAKSMPVKKTIIRPNFVISSFFIKKEIMIYKKYRNINLNYNQNHKVFEADTDEKLKMRHPKNSLCCFCIKFCTTSTPKEVPCPVSSWELIKISRIRGDVLHF